MGINYEDIYDEVDTKRSKKEIFADEPKAPVEKESNGPITAHGTVCNTELLNIRSQPTFESKVVRTLRRGEKVDIIKKIGEFYKIALDKERVGYISSKFCKEE